MIVISLSIFLRFLNGFCDDDMPAAMMPFASQLSNSCNNPCVNDDGIDYNDDAFDNFCDSREDGDFEGNSDTGPIYVDDEPFSDKDDVYPDKDSPGRQPKSKKSKRKSGDSTEDDDNSDTPKVRTKKKKDRRQVGKKKKKSEDKTKAIHTNGKDSDKGSLQDDDKRVYPDIDPEDTEEKTALLKKDHSNHKHYKEKQARKKKDHTNHKHYKEKQAKKKNKKNRKSRNKKNKNNNEDCEPDSKRRGRKSRKKMMKKNKMDCDVAEILQGLEPKDEVPLTETFNSEFIGKGLNFLNKFPKNTECEKPEKCEPVVRNLALQMDYDGKNLKMSPIEGSMNQPAPQQCDKSNPLIDTTPLPASPCDEKPIPPPPYQPPPQEIEPSLPELRSCAPILTQQPCEPVPATPQPCTQAPADCNPLDNSKLVPSRPEK